MDRNDKLYNNSNKSTMTNTTIINATRACGRNMPHIAPTNHHLLAHSLNKNDWRVIWKKRRQKEQLDEAEDVDKRGDRKMESNHSPGIPDRVAEREMESSDSPGIPHRMMAGWGGGEGWHQTSLASFQHPQCPWPQPTGPQHWGTDFGVGYQI